MRIKFKDFLELTKHQFVEIHDIPLTINSVSFMDEGESVVAPHYKSEDAASPGDCIIYASASFDALTARKVALPDAGEIIVSIDYQADAELTDAVPGTPLSAKQQKRIVEIVLKALFTEYIAMFERITAYEALHSAIHTIDNNKEAYLK